MNFCLNCRVFGDPFVVHRENCPAAILVKLETRQIGLSCDRCAAMWLDVDGKLPHMCSTKGCRGQYTIPVYEYPKELRRS